MKLRGARVGDYRIRHEVGASARGMLYVASHVRTGRAVMLELIAADDGMLKQLQQEQRAARLVPHRGVVDWLESGHSAHGAFVATELIRGESLPTRLKRKRLSADEIGSVFSQLIEIVASFQRISLVHGGLDIRQVLLEKTAADTLRVRLLDFGIVRKADKLFGSFAAAERQEAAAAKRNADIQRGLNVDILALGEILSACLPRVLPWSRAAREHQYLRVAALCSAREPGKQPRNCDELGRVFALASAKIEVRSAPSQWMYAALVLALLLAFSLVVVRGFTRVKPELSTSSAPS